MLIGHDLRWHKIGVDGSGKCDAFFTDNPLDAVIGGLFEIDKTEKWALDQAEGLGYGYREKIITVHDATGNRVEAQSYCATAIDSQLKPHSWYLNHVIIGARETRVPRDYLGKILAVASTEDPDKMRDAQQRAMHRR